jgi:hypothetical protein
MAPEKQPERDPFLTAVEAKIAAWTAVRDSYLAAKGLDGSDLPVTGLTSGRPTDLPVGVFRGKGVKEAIVIYLEATKRKQTNKEIAAGLAKGGIATTAANFESTVATALLRLKNDGVVLRFPDGWDLAGSYPESLRARLAKGEDRASRPTKKTKRRKAATTPEPKDTLRAITFDNLIPTTKAG